MAIKSILEEEFMELAEMLNEEGFEQNEEADEHFENIRELIDQL